MKRRLTTILLCLPFFPLLLLSLLWLRTINTTDVFMLPLTSSQTLLLTSHSEGPSGRWLELTLVSYWPQRALAWWSGPNWRNVGPFKFWQAHRFLAYDLRYNLMWGREGQLIVPRSSPNGPPACERSYDRAVAVGYPDAIPPGDPNWAAVKARELGISFIPVLPASLLLATRPSFYAFADYAPDAPAPASASNVATISAPVKSDAPSAATQSPPPASVGQPNKTCPLRHSGFGHSSLIRHSDFVIRICSHSDLQPFGFTPCSGPHQDYPQFHPASVMKRSCPCMQCRCCSRFSV